MNQNQKDFLRYFHLMIEAAQRDGVQDPISGGRVIEYQMACYLGHTISKYQAGPDAFDQSGNPCEYKSVKIGSGGAQYNILCGSTREGQIDELAKSVLDKDHYIAFQDFDGTPVLIEIWKLDGQTVFNQLIPKIMAQYGRRGVGKVLKDPRARSKLPNGFVRERGKRVWSRE